MRRWMRWALVGLLVVVVLITFDISRTNDKACVAQREQGVRYGVMLERVRSEYPIGSSLGEVTARLRQEHVSYSESSRELLIPLGSDPSYFWYCNNWITYADLKFDGEVFHGSPAFKLQSIEKQVIGGTCL